MKMIYNTVTKITYHFYDFTFYIILLIMAANIPENDRGYQHVVLYERKQ